MDAAYETSHLIVVKLASWRIAATGALVVAVIVSGAVTLPQASFSFSLFEAADDPVQLTELRLPTVATEQRIAAEIDDALSKGDGDLARSFLDLAVARGVKVDADRRARLGALVTPSEAPAGEKFLDGVTFGSADTWSGMAGALTADIVGISDVRDLWQEGGKLIQGEPYDKVILGLSTAGLALTGFTVAALLPSGGGSIAAKAPAARGLSLLKATRRAGLLSRELAGKLGGMAASAMDTVALKEAVAAVRAFDLSAARLAARRAIRPGALRTISSIGDDMVALEARVGQRGAAQALGVARDVGELSRARRLAQGMGGRTRAALKLLGSAALVLGDIAGLLLQAVWLAAGWMMMAALAARRLGSMIGRVVWGPPPVRRAAF
ncbi:hypothetical protein OKC48_13585 [Methylorubrum extorquens]|uniref:hypothetical protein n=1 Tax=Methylorubrum extorquens TaxID=408 RepID=UPI002237BD0B|nr:hypothetical protein [Methylorubrum extorquens]UYW29487.1 hypothetical protein OKC48_13585 [Methylorubrum extorquens]